jgi:3-methyladenine DNA glycosylase/8-oxoguanine DNA glycosylase
MQAGMDLEPNTRSSQTALLSSILTSTAPVPTTHTHRPGLNARQSLFATSDQSDQMQVAIEAGTNFELDNEIEQLRSSVGRLKQVSTAIAEESRLTQQVLDSLEHAIQAAQVNLKATMKRLNRVFKRAKSNHMIYLLVFALAVFFAVFMFNKIHGFLAWIFGR